MSSRRTTGQGRRTASGRGFQPKSASSVKKEVKTQILSMAERKYVDTDVDSGTIATTGVVQQLNGIAQASTVSGRTGDSVFVKSIVARGRFQPVSAGNCTFRYMFILWKPNSTPTASQILEDDGSEKCVISNYNHEYKKSFKVLYDSGCQFAVTQEGNPSSTSAITTIFLQNVLQKLVLPINQKCEYTAASSTNSDNRLYFIRWSAGSNDVSSKVQIRLNYLDM